MTIEKLRKIPVIGKLILVANAYAWKGDSRYVKYAAPKAQLNERILKKVWISLAGALIVVLLSGLNEKPISQHDIADLALSVFPNLLGFGIGVFALIFMLPPKFVSSMNASREKAGFDARILAPDMGYPLAVLAVVLLLSVVLKFIPETWIGKLIATFLIVYGLIIIIELVTMIYMAASKFIREQSSDQNDQAEKPGASPTTAKDLNDK